MANEQTNTNTNPTTTIPVPAPNQEQKPSPQEQPKIAGKFNTEADAIKGITEAGIKKYGSIENFYKSLAKDLKPEVQPQEETNVNPETNAAANTEQPAPQEQNNEQPNTQVIDPNMATVEDARKVATDAGLDWDDLQQEWFDNNGLKQETYDSFAAKGVTKEQIDTFIENQKAKATLLEHKLFGPVGGKENYQNFILPWASQNLDQAEATKVAKLLQSKDEDLILMGMEILKDKYTKAKGNSPKLIQGNPAPVVGGGFVSKDEMIKAMQDPRYKAGTHAYDPAYAKSVKDKLAYNTKNGFQK